VQSIPEEEFCELPGISCAGTDTVANRHAAASTEGTSFIIRRQCTKSEGDADCAAKLLVSLIRARKNSCAPLVDVIVVMVLA
jgi:hypothetical protein